MQIATDAKAERPFLPDPQTLTDRLPLADRGYPSVAYFEAVAAHGGAFIVRLTRSYDPWILAAWVEGQRTTVPTRIRLSRFLAQHAGQRVDLDVEFHCRLRVVGFRVVVLPGREATMTRLCTNLPRTPFSLSTPSSPRCSSASVFAGPSGGAPRIHSRTQDARTWIAIAAPAAYGPGWASWRPLK